MHRGTMLRIDHPDQSAYLYGVVSEDKKKALFTYAQLVPASSSHPATLRFRGLEADQRYRLAPIFPAGRPREMAHSSPTWFSGIEISGDALMGIGVTAPILEPENALLIEIVAL
jgi:alpha-galactosidase